MRIVPYFGVHTHRGLWKMIKATLELMYLISYFEVRILMCFSSHENVVEWNVTEASRNLGEI